MAHSRFLLSLLLLILNVTTFASAFAIMTESNCTNFTFPEDGGVRELCFAVQVYGPSPYATTLSNGTEVVEYVGESSETDMFEGDLEGLVTEIKWDEAVSLVDCVASVTMNNETMECSSCALCDDSTSVSADCTNLDQGEYFVVSVSIIDPQEFPLAHSFYKLSFRPNSLSLYFLILCRSERRVWRKCHGLFYPRRPTTNPFLPIRARL